MTSGISDAQRRRIGALPEGRGLLGVIIRESESVRIADIADRSAAQRVPATPSADAQLPGRSGPAAGPRDRELLPHQQAWGGRVQPDDQRLVERFALHAAIAIDNARLHEQVRRLAVVEERDRIGRDLHDGVIQRLYAVTLALDDVPELMDEAPADARDRVERSIEALQSAIGDIRAFIYDLRPVLLSAGDLRAALLDAG